MSFIVSLSKFSFGLRAQLKTATTKIDLEKLYPGRIMGHRGRKKLNLIASNNANMDNCGRKMPTRQSKRIRKISANQSCEQPIQKQKSQPVSATATDIIDNDRKDWSSCLNIFPEEVWHQILTKLEYKGKMIASSCSLYFRRLLLPYRQYFLFHDVWSILNEQNNKTKHTDHYDDYHSRESKEIHGITLKMRLVCKEWNFAIVNLYENHDSLYQMSMKPGPGQYRTHFKHHEEIGYWTRAGFVHERSGQINKFMNFFNLTHDSDTNPFFGRRVKFCSMYAWDHRRPPAPPAHECLEWFSQAAELLGKYGHHIWFCTLEISCRQMKPVDYCSHLRGLLQLMPNLKVLRLSSFIFNCWLQTNEKREIQELFSNQPMPRLENLEFLWCYKVPRCILDPFLAVNNHVKMIEIQYGDNFDLRNTEFSNLKRISLKLSSAKDLYDLKNCVKQIPLETLYLALDGGFRHMPWRRIFQTLETWKDSLTDLAVAFTEANTQALKAEIIEDSVHQLNLPKLKRLKFHADNFYSFEFMLPMRDTLEVLNISSRLRYAARVNFSNEHHRCYEGLPDKLKAVLEKDKLVNVRFGNLASSNIWKMFPRLKTISRKIKEEDPKNSWNDKKFESCGRHEVGCGVCKPIYGKW